MPKQNFRDITNGNFGSSSSISEYDDMEVDLNNDEEVEDETSVSLPSEPELAIESIDLEEVLDKLSEFDIGEEVEPSKKRSKRPSSKQDEVDERENNRKRNFAEMNASKAGVFSDDKLAVSSKRQKKSENSEADQLGFNARIDHFSATYKKRKTESSASTNSAHELLDQILISESLQFALDNNDDEILNRFVANHSKLHFDWTKIKSKTGYTLLHYAILDSALSYVTELTESALARGVDLRKLIVTDDGNELSLIHFGMMNVDYEVVAFLIEEFKKLCPGFRIVDSVKMDPFMIIDAIRSESPNMLVFLLRICQKEDVSFDILTLPINDEVVLVDLMLRCEDSLEIFSKLFEVLGSKVIVEYRDKEGYSLLHRAVEQESFELFFKLLGEFKKHDDFDLATHFVDGSNFQNCYNIAKFRNLDAMCAVIQKIGGVVHQAINKSLESESEIRARHLSHVFASFVKSEGGSAGREFLAEAIGIIRENEDRSKPSKGKEKDI